MVKNDISMNGKLIIFSAPSGSGKSTIINYLLKQGLNLQFSISATSRPPRGTEQDGVEYFFLSPEEFKKRIANDEFVEYEEVYPDRFYGTLKSQVEKQLAEGQNIIFDVDVSMATVLCRSLSSRLLSKNCASVWKDAGLIRRKLSIAGLPKRSSS